MKLLLASVSPRRRELLATLCPFEVEPSFYQEKEEGGAAETALKNARGKAKEVLARFPKCRVLGADTVVALGDLILGKPQNGEDAKRMLRLLSGKTHSVFTGVCLASEQGVKEKVVETKVTFKALSDETVLKYILSGAPLDKAGAYGIQDGVVVKCYEGSYTNVMGLPVETVAEMLLE